MRASGAEDPAESEREASNPSEVVDGAPDGTARDSEEQSGSRLEGFELALTQFSARLDGLRELLEVISPHVGDLDRSDTGMERDIAGSGFSEAGSEAMKILFASDEEDLQVDDEPSEAADPNEPSDGDEQKVELEDDSEDDWLSEEQKQDIGRVLINEPAEFAKFARLLLRRAMEPREELLRSSLLTVAVAALEALIAAVASEHFSRFPGALGGDEKEFSLRDLQELGSLEEARTVLVDRRVDAFMRRGFSDWSEWMKANAGAGFDDLALDYNALNEVVQRRHLVVHSGGTVSRLYLERVDFPEGEAPAVGDRLTVDADYLDAALDQIEILGFLLTCLAWRKWDPNIDGDGDHKAASELIDRNFELMRIGRWDLSSQVCSEARKMDMKTASSFVFQVNLWLAQKRLGQGDWKTAVEAWDTSALSSEFDLAKAALLDDFERGIALIEHCLATGQLTLKATETWPLLEELRAADGFEDAVKAGAAAAKADPSQSKDEVEAENDGSTK